MEKESTIALAGNPNSGKTTVFNNLTGARQHVGNYPGVTVEKKEGKLKYKDQDINVVDLPGTYSLTAYSIDEVVARDFVIEEKPDVVIDIVDASNLERNLYLATQFMELGVPLVIALNMSDIAKARGQQVNNQRLSELLGVPLIPTVAKRKEGTKELIDEAVKVAEGKEDLRKVTVSYGKEIEEEILKIEHVLKKDKALLEKYPARWLTVKLLESDIEVQKKVKESPYAGEILAQVESSVNHLKSIFGDDLELVIADRRYGFISGACHESVERTAEERLSASDEIDKVITNRILGLPIFLALMWLVFKMTFKFSEAPMSWIERAQGWLGGRLGNLFAEGSALQSLVVDGIIGGVGSVLVFVPIIFLLFLAIALLEDSGYMARAVFIMDRVMHKMGLHGRSFIPMILGFGCNVPAIMATRTIEDRRNRLVTILINPLMSCGARLPVYTLLAGAFFNERIAGNVIFSIYMLGVALAVIVAKLFRKFLFPGPSAPFVMELPPYRMPTLKGLMIHMWERGALYLKKAGTIIFVGCVLIWFLSNFPYNPKDSGYERLEKSYAGRMGRAIEPVIKPLGFDWKIGVGLVGGFIAKEIVVGTLGVLYQVEEVDEESETLRAALQNDKYPGGRNVYNPLVAYTLMVFVLIYVPCVACIAVIKRETNSWRWPIFSVFYLTALAWIMAFIVYQGGRLLGLGG
ncbi:ferrous iron transport protein B [bacterium]|nr:ferrous iron transport protein B [bacterium]